MVPTYVLLNFCLVVVVVVVVLLKIFFHHRYTCGSNIQLIQQAILTNLSEWIK